MVFQDNHLDTLISPQCLLVVEILTFLLMVMNVQTFVLCCVTMVNDRQMMDKHMTRGINSYLTDKHVHEQVKYSS